MLQGAREERNNSLMIPHASFGMFCFLPTVVEDFVGRTYTILQYDFYQERALTSQFDVYHAQSLRTSTAPPCCPTRYALSKMFSLSVKAVALLSFNKRRVPTTSMPSCLCSNQLWCPPPSSLPARTRSSFPNSGPRPPPAFPVARNSLCRTSTFAAPCTWPTT